MEIYLQIMGGLALLVSGGELLVRGAVSVAKTLNVSPLVIGLTLVGFGTSTPELVTSIVAGLEGSPGIAVGNIVGSNIANILLILGFAAVINPITVDPKGFGRDAAWLLASALLLVVVVLWGGIDRLIGIAMITALMAYTIHVYRSEQADPSTVTETKQAKSKTTSAWISRPGIALAVVCGGIVATIFGASLLVEGAIVLARRLEMSEAIIGLTIVAVGTSLPEMVTSFVAAYRQQSGIAYGNIVGSNIYNILFILGVTALAQPIAIPAQIARFDIWIMLAATTVLIFMVRSSYRLVRWEGIAFLAAYAAYVWYLVSIPSAV